MGAASLAFLLLSKHRLQKSFPCSTHLSVGRSSPKTWTLDVTAKLSADVGPGASSDPFQPPVFRPSRGTLGSGSAAAGGFGPSHIQGAASSRSDGPEQWHKQEDKGQQREKDMEIKLLDTYWFSANCRKPFCHPAEPNERWQLPPCRHPLPLEDGTAGGRRALAAAEMDFTPAQLPSVPAVLPTIAAAEMPDQTKKSTVLCALFYIQCIYTFIYKTASIQSCLFCSKGETSG